MKIGIITIATGKYSIYVPGLVKSCELLFLKDHEKKYFVYTDSDGDDFKNFEACASPPPVSNGPFSSKETFTLISLFLYRERKRWICPEK